MKAKLAPKRFSLLALLMAAVMTMSLGGCATGEVPTPAEIKKDNADSRARQFIRVGDASQAGGDVASALAFYQRAQTMRPEWDEPYRRIGKMALALGMAGDAAQAFSKLSNLVPGDAGALIGLGRSLIALDQPEKAADAFRRAQVAAHGDHRPLNGLGVAEDLMGNHTAAQAAYRSGLALAPDSLSLANNYGLSLALSGDFAQAIKILGDAAKAPGAGPRARQNLALVYGLAGDMDRAEKLGRLDLSETQVQNNLKRYQALRNLSDTARARAVHTGQSPDP